ncbi:hypothetical protein [Mycobacterium sp. NPDC006124]|uniref:hypothetical protein n=1 Tax=Mycobacterium sp. NPDC006124 TaxID=3156729 RepID=UPI0033ABBC64
MLRTIQSNIDDRYDGPSPFADPFLRSVTVFAVGSPDAVGAAEVRERLRDRAIQLLNAEVTEEAEAHFVGGSDGLSVGEPFGVGLSDGAKPHRVRVVDGPLDDEAIVAVRVLGRQTWAS